MQLFMVGKSVLLSAFAIRKYSSKHQNFYLDKKMSAVCACDRKTYLNVWMGFNDPHGWIQRGYRWTRKSRVIGFHKNEQ